MLNNHELIKLNDKIKFDYRIKGIKFAMHGIHENTYTNNTINLSRPNIYLFGGSDYGQTKLQQLLINHDKQQANSLICVSESCRNPNADLMTIKSVSGLDVNTFIVDNLDNTNGAVSDNYNCDNFNIVMINSDFKQYNVYDFKHDKWLLPIANRFSKLFDVDSAHSRFILLKNSLLIMSYGRSVYFYDLSNVCQPKLIDFRDVVDASYSAHGMVVVSLIKMQKRIDFKTNVDSTNFNNGGNDAQRSGFADGMQYRARIMLFGGRDGTVSFDSSFVELFVWFDMYHNNNSNNNYTWHPGYKINHIAANNLGQFKLNVDKSFSGKSKPRRMTFAEQRYGRESCDDPTRLQSLYGFSCHLVTSSITHEKMIMIIGGHTDDYCTMDDSIFLIDIQHKQINEIQKVC